MNYTTLIALPLIIWQSLVSEIHLTITDLEHDKGTVQLLVFNRAEGFPDAAEQAVKAMTLPISNGRAVISIKDLPPGKYAISAFHDQDGDGMLRKGLFGVPKEPYGFSNNARGTFAAPSFEKASFTLGYAAVHISFSLSL